MRKVSLFGYGKTTKALGRLIKNVVFYDDKCSKPFKDENGFSIKPTSDFNEKYSDLEIVSPGIPPSNLMIKKAKHLISEYDYFTHSKPLQVWISGTNGKTTTTQMMKLLLEDKNAIEGGNIGTPLAEMSQNASIWLLETSSFMLHYTNIASPNIYILLPIKEDHTDWHNSFEEYKNAKLKPIYTMKEGEIAIVPRKYKKIQTNATIIYYSNSAELASYFNIDISKMDFKGVFLLDAILAMSVDKILFDRIDYEKINSFKVDCHRQELVLDKNKRRWINDSKATNIDATIELLKQHHMLSIHLVLGGDDKSADLSILFRYISKLNICVYGIGSNKEKINLLCKTHKINFILCENIHNAVEKIDKVLKIDEIAILSPAASSLDEFSSYSQRGNLFKKAIEDL